MPLSIISFPSLLDTLIAFAGLTDEMQHPKHFLMCALCKDATIPRNTITGKISKAKAIPDVALVGKPRYASIISSVMMKVTIKSTKLSNKSSV